MGILRLVLNSLLVELKRFQDLPGRHTGRQLTGYDFVL